jgi:hypothetical protein
VEIERRKTNKEKRQANLTTEAQRALRLHGEFGVESEVERMAVNTSENGTVTKTES